MNIEQLEYIVEVAKTRSISAASNNLQVTVSTISQSISGLENELGIKLFVRDRNGSIPTPEGLPIIKKALKILYSIQEIREESKLHTETLNGKLRLGAIPGAMPLLVNTIAWFNKEYPKVQFELSEDGSDQIFEKIRLNQIDLGLISMDSNSLKSKAAGFVFEPITEEKVSIGVGRNSPLASLKSVKPTDLLSYSFVLYNDDHVLKFIDNLKERIGPIHILFTTNNVDAITNALKKGLAITAGYTFSFIKSNSILNEDVVKLDIEQFDQLSLSLGWVMAENNKASKIARLFMERFKYEFSKRQL
jgi:DNA-binding transcriptional LysR family regulator